MNNAWIEKWSVAVFAHNEADNIVRCLTSILMQNITMNFPIHVLANGCTDRTVQLVEALAKVNPSIKLFNIEVPDKANSWNYYTHKVAPESECHFFIDGDVVIEPMAFNELYKSLTCSNEAVAAGGLPASGRSCAAWSHRMVSMGRLAGSLYLLHGDFLESIREQEIHIPIGFVGEDFFFFFLAKGQLNLNGINISSPRVVFNPRALFSFESLSPRNPKHWWAYFSRLVRYQIREYQLLMLFFFMYGKTQQEIPPDVQTLYRGVEQLPRYRWRGRITPVDIIAVWKIRNAIGNWV